MLIDPGYTTQGHRLTGKIWPANRNLLSVISLSSVLGCHGNHWCLCAPSLRWATSIYRPVWTTFKSILWHRVSGFSPAIRQRYLAVSSTIRSISSRECLTAQVSRRRVDDHGENTLWWFWNLDLWLSSSRFLCLFCGKRDKPVSDLRSGLSFDRS